MTDATTNSEQRHLVSLVLQSKKALQHGEQLCSRARDSSKASAACAVDVLAIDAKVQWIADGVVQQLKVSDPSHRLCGTDGMYRLPARWRRA